MVSNRAVTWGVQEQNTIWPERQGIACWLLQRRSLEFGLQGVYEGITSVKGSERKQYKGEGEVDL